MKCLASMAVVLAVATAGLSLGAGPAAAESVPFTDPASRGKITLCNTRGEAVTSGDIRVKPFVWSAVGSTPAPAGYRTGGTAQLYGYQPISGVDPNYWFGELLTASARFTNPDRPMARATASDATLSDYLGDYPTKWDGLVQLRLILSAQGEPGITQFYDTAVLKVSGTKWTLLDGGTSGCGSGNAVSAEMVLPSVSALGTPAPNATTDSVAQPSNGSASAAGRSSSGSAPAGAARSVDAAGPTAAPTSNAPKSISATGTQAATQGTSSSGGLWWGLAAAGVLGAAASAWFWRRSKPAG